MGKTNKAQRTKGNTKPSSSGHSAQLLSLSGRTINGFIGFDGLDKDKATYVPATGQQISESCDSCVDSDFRMVMRKMLKRDAVTRLKAVQEFKEYCAEKDVDAVKNVLPFWPRLFNKLALDTDRRIREATHFANGELISKIKREIAPHLKSIMGVWLLGQCDLHAPAASAAQATFSSTFPSTKQSDALLHCKEEIFSYYKDNLFEQTAKTLSDPSSTTPEDMENKYILVISGTLQALKLLLTVVHPSEYSSLKDSFYNIVVDKKFWKFSKSKEAEIRGSWYALISSLCQFIKNVFNEMENKLVNTVLGCLSEADPVVAPSVWEAALSVVANFENCWLDININKVVLPQLWIQLKNGGNGNAKVIFPCLLPFLSKFPKEVVESETFLLQFFGCLKQSLFLESVKLSHMECDAILTAYMECIQYICCIRCNVEISASLLEKILLNELIPVVESSFFSRETHLAASKLYPLLGTLIGKIEYKCISKKEISDAFSKILNAFWENLILVLSKVFHLKKEKKIETIMYLSYFFHSMFIPSDILLIPEKTKVRFENDDSNELSSTKCSEAPKMTDPYSVSLSAKNSVSFPYIVNFSKHLCEHIKQECDIYYLNLLAEILGSASNNELFIDLISSANVSDCVNEPSQTFFNATIMKWIDQASHDCAKLNTISELIFIMCSNIQENEALKILLCCSEIENSTLLHCMLSIGSKNYSNAPLLHEWVRNPIFSTSIVNCFLNLIKKMLQRESINAHDSKMLLNLLHLCLTTKLIEKPLVDIKSMEKILLSLKELSEEIFKLEDINYQCGIDFLCDTTICILKNYKICWNLKVTDDLICMIFSKSLTSYRDSLPRNLIKVWTAAIESYIHTKSEIVHDDSLILKMATKLHTPILSLSSLDESNHVLNHCIEMISTIQESLIAQKSKLQYSSLFALYKIMDIILPTIQEWRELKIGFDHNTVPLFLRKKLFYPLYVEESFFPPGNLQKLLLISYIVMKIILHELQRSNTLADNKFHESYVTKHFPHLLWFSTFFEESSAVNMLSEELSSIKISQACFKMLSFLPNGIADIVNEIVESSLIYGAFWAVPLQFLIDHSDENQCQTITFIIQDMLEKEHLTENLNKYILQQILISHLPPETQNLQMRKVFYEIHPMQDVSDENFAGKLSEICCYIQNYDVELTEEMQNILKDILCRIIDYDFEDSNLELAYDLQLTSVLSSVPKYGPCLFNAKIVNYFIETLKNFLQISLTISLENPTASLEIYQTWLIFKAFSDHQGLHSTEYCKNFVEMPVMDDNTYKNLISLYIYTANTYNQLKPLPDICRHILMTLSEAIKDIPSEPLIKIIEECTEIPQFKSSTFLQSLVSSLTFDIRQIQTTSHSLLLKVMRSLPDLQLCSQKTPNEDEKDEDIEKIPVCLSPLIQLLTFLTELEESMLSDFKIGDLSVVIPKTDSYVYTMAYLLAWIELLEFISSSPSQIRSVYATHLEETKLLSQLFSNVFRLMPSNPMLCLKKSLNLGTPRKEDLKLLFINPPVLNSEFPNSEDIQTIASYVYATVLRKVPASIRTWWNNLDRKSADIVNKFTTMYVSGILCVEEIQAVHESEKQFENMMVQARPGSREVIAIYTIDDCAIELSVQLPINYPLGPISAERKGKIVIGQLEWRHWLMQLTTVLRYQNGSILDGLKIWKRNLDKKFEGVEECMICYYVLHSSTLKLPRLSCRVCKKKFHSACLYKWFDTSYNSTCPLCRNEFFIPMQK